ncbi:hypothetical protein ACHAWC_000608, partial [Mediolabrus comicus]
MAKQGGSQSNKKSAVPPTRRRDGPSPTNSAATASTVSTKNSSSSSKSNGSRPAKNSSTATATRKSAGKGGAAAGQSRGKRGAAASTRSKGGNKGKGRRQAAPLTPQEERAAKRKKIISRIISLLIVLGCLFCAWKFALNSPITPEQWKEGFGQAQENAKTNIGTIGDKINDVLENLDGFEWGNFFKDDPWQGETDVTLWKEKYIERNGGGLTLTIVNNLNDKWQEEFEVAVADWKRSDALTLTVEKGSADKGCTREQGVMVVCNDNFGETGWVGINENEVETGSNRIISSLAKMNEYYLRNANFYHRRFTMCHEIGHGFGLPHTDEN